MRNVPVSIVCTLTLLASAGAMGCGDNSAGPPMPRDPAMADASDIEATQGEVIVVHSSAELVAALSPANAGRRILVRAGSYDVDAPLTVPDGATVRGDGVMRFNGAGLPAGFTASTRTTLRMTGNTPGNMLTLGDGATIRGLQIEDLAGRAGNVVAVVSREAGDHVSANIVECEIINPNASGAGPEGPTGEALLVLTRNVNLGADPLPHEGATLAARMVRSVIRAPAGGGGLFAFNFAPLGKVSVTVAGNIVGGSITANGGVSRPDAVHDAEVTIKSHHNLYRDDRADPCVLPRLGWNLTGGSGPPVPLPVPVPETARNALRVHSVDDRIERFTTGIFATGSRRFFPSPTAGPSTDNAVDLELLGARISTPTCAGAPTSDLGLVGAFAGAEALVPGNGNVLRAVVRGVTGSGPRANRYAHALGPAGALPADLAGEDNRLEIVGSPAAFGRTNRRIDPAPEAGHFIGGSH